MKVIQDFLDGATQLLRQRLSYFGPHDREGAGSVRCGALHVRSGLERKAKPEEYVGKVEERIKEEA